MPVYEFRCRRCQHRFETLCGFDWERKVRCPVCDAAEVEKLLSCFAVTGSDAGKGGGACTSCSGKSCATCK